MKDFIVRRNGSIIAVLTADQIPVKDDRLVFDGNEYVVIARKWNFTTQEVGGIVCLDLPDVHVNHIRVLIEGIHNG